MPIVFALQVARCPGGRWKVTGGSFKIHTCIKLCGYTMAVAWYIVKGTLAEKKRENVRIFPKFFAF